MSAAIEIRDLFRVHSTPEGDAAALQGLSLAVREHEVLTVLGPSGSGKSSLLRILAGLDRPSAGVVRVLGEEIGKLTGRRLSRYRASTLGYADQHYSRALAGELTARALVGLQLGLRGTPRGERDRRADELLERVGLAERRGAHPAELSGGEQQRVALCAALAHRPRIFLADEPTGELDARSADLVYDLIGELAREHGCTTVIVSHDPESVRIADRIVRIRDGRVSEEWAREGDAGDTIVVGRGGWLRLPEELLVRAGIGSRATARLEAGAILVEPAGAREGKPTGLREPEGASPEGARHLGSTIAPTVEVRGLSRRFASGPVFTGLDASLDAGRLHAVTGPSGSGKTTFLNLLAGLDVPDAGAVTVLGTDLAGLDRAARAAFRRDHIGYVSQQPELIPFLTARENVELGLAVRGRPTLRALEALEAVGLAERAAQRVSRLSTGERGRVAIARALAARPELLLADEPTSRLDEANAAAVASLLARLARDTGATIVCATHDPVVVEHADAEIAL